jgi:ribosome biogenesis GTPase
MTTLAGLGWDDAWAGAYAPHARPGHWPARVIRGDRGVCTVLGPAGTGRASAGGGLLAAAAGDPRLLPCAGDWVVVRDWPDGRTTIEAVLPRRTRVVRAQADRRSLGQVLAANVDALAVVEPMDPAPDLARIERLLAVAWESGARPLVVLTKTDLVPDPAAVAAQVADTVAGAPVLALSAHRRAGLAQLAPEIRPGRTLGLLGSSGSGKSTLVNALAGATVMATQGLRRRDGRGRHTTTYRALVPLPGGGCVLDTPGLRGVALHGDGDGLDDSFGDVTGLAAGCRFRDCTHRVEPGCAVLAAVANGLLAPRRLESWRHLQREVAARRRRTDARAAAEQRSVWRRRIQDQRAARRARGIGR